MVDLLKKMKSKRLNGAEENSVAALKNARSRNQKFTKFNSATNNMDAIDTFMLSQGSKK